MWVDLRCHISKLFLKVVMILFLSGAIFKKTTRNLLNSVSIFKVRTEFVLSHRRNDCVSVFDLKGVYL
jgi:hypothetical protein